MAAIRCKLPNYSVRVLCCDWLTFFEQRQGDLLFHPENKMLCYLGPHDLFQVSSKQQNISDISTLRGHLRTFKLKQLENLQHDLLQFLK